jgi:lipid II:glycine glycyltransferase (peptidoglycan interpeptide bridge formation enzyme)
MVRITSNIEEISIDSWKDFIHSHDKGNFFQSPDYYFSLRNDKNNNARVLFALNQKELLGVLLLVIQKENYGPLSYFSSKIFIHGGPLTKNNDVSIAELLVKSCVSKFNKAASYIEIKNIYDLSSLEQMLFGQKFRFHDHLNILLDLNKPEEELWYDLSAKRRNQVRKAEKKACYFEELSVKNKVDQSYSILQEVYQRIKLPLAEVEFFENLESTLDPNIFRIFVAKHHGVIIATIYAICYEKRLFIWFSGAYQAHYDKQPNDFLYWQVILWAKKNGYELIDFGGAGKPGVDYGVRDFKKQFGGLLVNFGRYLRINNTVLYYIAKLGFSILKVIRKFK